MPGKQPAGMLEAECVVKGFQGGRRREGVRMRGVLWPLVGLTAFLSSPPGAAGSPWRASEEPWLGPGCL